MGTRITGSGRRVRDKVRKTQMKYATSHYGPSQISPTAYKNIFSQWRPECSKGVTETVDMPSSVVTGQIHEQQTGTLSKPQDSSMCKWADLETKFIIELTKLQVIFGKFSYYMTKERCVMYAEDEKARDNWKLLTAAAAETARRLFQDQCLVYPKTPSDSLNAMLCAEMHVNGILQATGMCMQFDRVVYWVSVAHNFYESFRNPLPNQNDPSEDPIRTITRTLACQDIKIDCGIDLVEGNDIRHVENRVPCSTPYACRIITPKDNMGRTILHSVDIMIGQVPEVFRVNEDHNAEEVAAVNDMAGQRDFAISRVFQPTKFAGNDSVFHYVRYDIISCHREHVNVAARLPGGRFAVGEIMGFGRVIEYEGVLLISSSNGIVPLPGDSGSVWISQKSLEAVAITVGKCVDNIIGEAWVVMLLLPCLQVLSQEHVHTFPDVSRFQSLEGNQLLQIDQ